jgi:hypothetical protein
LARAFFMRTCRVAPTAETFKQQIGEAVSNVSQFK